MSDRYRASTASDKLERAKEYSGLRSVGVIFINDDGVANLR
jgi:hypothetical protein